MTHAFGCGEVDKPALGKDMDRFSFNHEGLDSIPLDDFIGVLVEPFDIDLNIEMTGI